MIEFLLGFLFAGGEEEKEDRLVPTRTMQVVGTVILLALIVGIFVFLD